MHGTSRLGTWAGRRAALRGLAGAGCLFSLLAMLVFVAGCPTAGGGGGDGDGNANANDNAGNVNDNGGGNDNEPVPNDNEPVPNDNEPEPECVEDADCDDGLVCNGAETCGDDGTCVAGTALCDEAAGETCDEATGTCTPAPGDDLSDENPDVSFDDLTVGSPVIISAPDPRFVFGTFERQPPEGCTCEWSSDGSGTFEPADGCENVTYTPAEDDTTITVNVVCTDLGIDTSFSQEVAVTGCAADADCDDGLFCNGDETCTVATGACAAGTNPCAADEDCTEGGGCEPVVCEVDADCDDGLFCNGVETCDTVTSACVAGTRPCGDLNDLGEVSVCGDTDVTQTCDEGDTEAVCTACEVVCIPFTEITDSPALLGTSGDDVFCAPTIFDAGTFPTFTNGDAAEGLAGNDLLNATLFATTAATTSVTLTGIETLNFTDAGTAVTTVDGSNFSDVTAMNSVGSVQTLTVTGVKNLPDFGITNSTKGAAITFTAAGTSTSADESVLTLSNATDGAFSVTTTAGTNAGLETISIASSGNTANKLTGVTETTGTSLKTVNVSGATALTLDLVDDSVSTVGGSTATGAITLGKGSAILIAPLYTAFQAAGDLKFVNTGTGNDTIIFAGTLTATDFDSTTANEGVDAGTGTDTVQMFPAGSLYGTGFALTGVEVLNIAANASALTVNLAEANLLTSVVNDTNASSEVITLSNCATIPDLTFTGDGVGSASQPFDGFTFSFISSASTSDDMAIAVGNRGTALIDGFVYTIGALTIPGVETFTLAINDSPDSTTIGGITATEIKSLTITGAGDLLLGTVGGATTDAMTTFNASAVTGKLGSSTATVVLDSLASTAAVTTPTASRAWISLAGSSGSTITLTTGSGADTITGSAQGDTIIAGADDDTITPGTGDDIVTPGAGIDTIVFAATSLDTLTLTSGDTDGTAIDDIFNFTASAAFIGTTTEDIFITADAALGSGDVLGAAGDNIVILTGSFFANAAALDAATTTDLSGLDTGNVLIVYSTAVGGDTRMAFCAVAAGGDLSGSVDLAVIPGLTVLEASTGLAVTNFVTD